MVDSARWIAKIIQVIFKSSVPIAESIILLSCKEDKLLYSSIHREIIVVSPFKDWISSKCYCNGFDQRVARQQLCKHGPNTQQ
jgi:hypothetical protein